MLVGVHQEELAADLGLDLAGTGLLGAALSLGIGVGVAGAGPLADRLPRRRLFAAAGLLAGGSLLSFAPDMGFPRALVQMAVVGIGIGALETVVNVAVTQRHGAASTRPLLFVHSAATIGAMLTPFAVALTLPAWTTSFHVTGAAALVLAGGVLFSELPAPPPRKPGLRKLPALGALLPFLVMGFAYVGVETTLTLFAVPYAHETLALTEARGREAIGIFWSGLLAARLLLMLVRRPIGAGFLVASGLAGAAIVFGGIGWQLQRVEIVYAAAGLAMGFVFPLMIALTAERFPDARGTATGLVAGAAAFGGFALPWLSGVLGDRVGVAPALAALAPWCLVVACAAALTQRGNRE
ncbi:MAG: MFS transporter [bacterium]|nr:MFS transporter [bacterium]